MRGVCNKNLTELSKENRIKSEFERIKIFFEEIDGNQRAIVEPLLQNSAFMKVTLEDLQDIINKDGAIDTYQNGANQYGTKQSATLQSYNSLIKNYAAVTRTLSQLLPPEKKASSLYDVFDWTPRKKTTEELKRERQQEEEHLQKIDKEIARAAEYQRQQREKEKAKERIS